MIPADIPQAYALALVGLGRGSEEVLEVPVLVAPHALVDEAAPKLRRSYGYTTLRHLLLGRGGSLEVTSSSQPGPIGPDALAAAEAVASALLLHGQAAAAARLLIEAVAAAPAVGDDATRKIACGAVADAAFGACCERGIVLEAAALLALRRRQVVASGSITPEARLDGAPSFMTPDDAADTVRSALLLDSQARLLGDLLGLHTGIGEALRASLVRSAIHSAADSSVEQWRMPRKMTANRVVPLELALRVRNLPPPLPHRAANPKDHGPATPAASAPSLLYTAAAEVCPEFASLLADPAMAGQPRRGADAGAREMPLTGTLVLACTASTAVNDSRRGAGESPSHPRPMINLDARAGRGGLCVVAFPGSPQGTRDDGVAAPRSGGPRPWVAVAGRRRTSLLAAALPCGGPVHVEWHTDGPDPLFPASLAASATGQLLVSHLGRAVGPPLPVGPVQDSDVAPATASAALRLQHAAAAAADALATDAQRVLENLVATGRMRHPAVIAAVATLASAGGHGAELARNLDLRELARSASAGAAAADGAMRRCHDAVVQGVAAAVPAYGAPVLRWLIFQASPADVLRVVVGAPLAEDGSEVATVAGAAVGTRAPLAAVPASVVARVHSTLTAYGNLLQLVSGGGAASAGQARGDASVSSQAPPDPQGGDDDRRAGTRAMLAAAAAFWEMRARGERPSGATYAAMLNAAGRMASPGVARSVLGDMRATGRLPLGGGGRG